MACTPQDLVTDARCLAAALSDRQLLASIACILATQNGMACDATTLEAESKCLWSAMNERQLLAAIAYLLCTGGGGGGGSAAVTPGAGAPPTDGSITTLFYKDTDTSVIYINTGTVAVPTWDPI